jgi:hypothetical protein
MYRTVTAHVDLCGCETWSLSLFENRVLSIVFGPKREAGENYIMRS